MLVGIHKDPYGKFCPFLQKYEEILDYNDIEHIRLDASEADFWEKVKKIDLFIFRWRHYDTDRQMAHAIIPVVEKELGIKCFPNWATCWHYDDKIKEYYLLKQHNFPIIESWIFWDRKEALKWVQAAKFPLVFKLKGGAASFNVVLLRNKAQANRLIHRIFTKGIRSNNIPHFNNMKIKNFSLYKTVHRWGGDILRILRGEDPSSFWQVHKNYVLFQRFLPNNDHDTRIVVIGNRAFALRRKNRRGDFRASGSGLLDYRPQKIDTNFITVAFSISKKMGFQSMGYDFLYDENRQPKICEISYTFPYGHFLLDCPGYWDQDLNWHKGHYWPQYFQLMDALNLPDLKQPEMEV